MDYGGHEAQNAARTLKALQRSPVFIQAVEHFGVDGVAGQKPVSVLYFPGLKREVRRVFTVHGAEMSAHHFSRGRVFAIQKEPAPYHFKAFVCCHRFPDGFHASKGVFNGFQCDCARFSADFDI